MAVNQLRYSQRYEKLRAQGVSHEEAHRQATKFATVKPVKPKKKKESKIKRLARLMKMIALGKRYKMPKKAKPRPPEKAKPRKLETVRTKAVTKQLRVAGLTEKEIARLKGKR